MALRVRVALLLLGPDPCQQPYFLKVSSVFLLVPEITCREELSRENAAQASSTTRK